MNTKTRSIYDVGPLTPEEKNKFEQDLKIAAIPEFVSALMEKDYSSVYSLAKIADIPPSIMQIIRSEESNLSMRSFFVVLKELGCNKVKIQINNEYVTFDISHIRK